MRILTGERLAGKIRPRRRVELVESGNWALPRGGSVDMDGDHVPMSTAGAGRRPALYTAGMLPRTGDCDRYSDLLAGLSENADLQGIAIRSAVGGRCLIADV